MNQRIPPGLVIAAVLLTMGGCKKAAPKTEGPKAVLEAYLRLDAEGKGMSSEGLQEMKPYVMWDQAAAWDAIAVIDGYTIGDLQAGATRAKAQVTYRRLGILTEHFEKAAAESVTYFLRHEGGQWKVDAPQLMPHVDARVMEEHLRRQTDASPEMLKVNQELLKQLEAAHAPAQ